MTTVIRAVGANFINPDLPSVVPKFITDGLVAAYRPSNAATGLNDLSGNGNNLTIVGSPVLTADGMVGDVLNGLKTGLLETLSLTYMAVYKIPLSTYVEGGFVMGCYEDIPPTSSTGSSFYSFGLSGAGHNLTAQSQYKKPDNTTAQATVAMGVIPDRYVFVAITVDAASNKVTAYCPTLATEFTTIPPTGAIGTRDISPTNKVQLVSGISKPTWTSKVNLAEALIYNKALTSAQIQEEYQKSKTYMQAQRSIAI